LKFGALKEQIKIILFFLGLGVVGRLTKIQIFLSISIDISSAFIRIHKK